MTQSNISPDGAFWIFLDRSLVLWRFEQIEQHRELDPRERVQQVIAVCEMIVLGPQIARQIVELLIDPRAQ